MRPMTWDHFIVGVGTALVVAALLTAFLIRMASDCPFDRAQAAEGIT